MQDTFLTLYDAQRVLQEVLRRKSKAVLNELHPKQKAFVLDPARFKAAICTRRAGKSWAAGADLLHSAATEVGKYDKLTFPYITLTRAQAKRNVWNILKSLNDLYCFGAAFHNTDLTATLPNGNVVWLTGAADEKQIEKLRGSHYRKVYIDEAASFAEDSLNSLIEEVISPALIDDKGSLILIGTPAAHCSGLFHDVTNTKRLKGWAVHRWTIFDNPYINDPAGEVKGIMDRFGYTESTPKFRREYRGEWVRSTESSVYAYDEELNTIDDIPPDLTHHVLGVDLGYHDPSAIVVISWHENAPYVYIHDCWKKERCDISTLAIRIKDYQKKYALNTIVVDSGGIGRTIVEELNTRHRIPAFPAEKTNKAGSIELMNADFLMGKIKVKKGEEIITEYKTLQWAADLRGEDKRYPNHLCDAACYGYREARHWLSKEKESKPQVGSREYIEAELSRYEKRLIAKINREGDEADGFINPDFVCDRA